MMSRMERLSMSSTSEGVGNLKFRMNALGDYMNDFSCDTISRASDICGMLSAMG